MPINVRVPLPGPFSYSHRAGGRVNLAPLLGTRRSSAQRAHDVAEIHAAQRDALAYVDTMTDRQVRIRHMVGWVAAVIIAAFFFASVYLIPLGVVTLVATWWFQRRRWQHRRSALIDSNILQHGEEY